ncbi:MAG TPA: hypothetical protein VF824_17715 [Thermoanaerobaculia bacterium]|jgi:hypothetical protein
MPNATTALYEPLIERDLDAIPSAARAFVAAQSVYDLWVAVTRFAVLAYAPSMHARHALLACRAAYELREAIGERWVELLIECARYTAESRAPWSEPPLVDPPAVESVGSLADTLRSGERLAAEQWLAAHLHDESLEDELRNAASDEAILLIDAAFALAPLLGEKGRYALLRTVVWELVAAARGGSFAMTRNASLDALIADAVAARGAVDAVQAVLVHIARERLPIIAAAPSLDPYPLARDYAQTLLAHAAARRLPSPDALLAAVHDNLQHGESYADLSFA